MEKNIFRIIKLAAFDEYLSNIEGCDLNIRDEFECGLLHTAVSKQKWEIAEDLIKRGIDVNMQDDNKNTVLHYLVGKINLDITEKILRAGGNPNIENVYGITPLYSAVCNQKHGDRKYDLLKLLLEYGGDINHKRSTTGDTPLGVSRNFYDPKLREIMENHK